MVIACSSARHQPGTWQVHAWWNDASQHAVAPCLDWNRKAANRALQMALTIAFPDTNA